MRPSPLTKSPFATEAVLEDVRAERRRQDEKWGEQNHDSGAWMLVLGEEVGELAEACLRRRQWLAPSSHHRDVKHREAERAFAEMRAEAVQVASVAVQFVEWIDRGAPIDETQIDERLQ